MKKLQLSCADFTFPLLTHEKVLDLIALLGFKGVDIGLFSGRSHLTAETEFTHIGRKARALKKKLQDRGLAATDIYLQLDNSPAKYAINHPEKKRRQFAREQFLKCIDYTKASGADHITCLPGMRFGTESYEQCAHRSYDELNWRVEQATAFDLSFSVEAHIGSPFIKPAYVLDLMKAVPGLTLTLDYTHFTQQGYAQKQVDPLLSHASHFHARGARKGKLQASMTDNTIDYTAIIKKLKDMRYTGWVGLEYIWIEWEQCNRVDTLSETIRLKNIIEAAFRN